MPLKTKIFIFIFIVTLVFNNPLKQTTAVNIINTICIFYINFQHKPLFKVSFTVKIIGAN